MQAEEFNHWDFYPLNLTPEQVINPLSVITTFFDHDSLPGHLETLQNWCFSVLKPDFFRDEKGSPSGLLYFHKLTLCLVEAASLIKDLPDKPNVTVTANDLSYEQREWSYYPVSLNKEQQLNPYLQLEDFFNHYNLPQYRAMLYDWLEHGLSRQPAREFIEPLDLLTVQENLQKLFGASWFIFQRLSHKPSLKSDLHVSRVPFSLSANLSQAEREAHFVTLYSLDGNLRDKQAALMSSLISIIIHKVSSVQAILYLGAAPNDKLYLLVLTDNEEQRLAQSLAGMIEDSCRETANVVALVHHASALFTALKRGNLFFNTALSRPAVYLSGELLMPVALPLSAVQHTASSSQWKHWCNLANDFHNGAGFHLKQEAYNAALFCLHQCAECVLVALIRAVLNYDINNHNLSRLLTITEMFTADLNKVFGLDNAHNLALFNELKQAYVNVRYKDGYEAEKHSVKVLSDTVKQLLNVAEKVYEQHLLRGSL
ncbi:MULTISPECIES: HEPN domain-containing protein [unclassified Mucilaginibacter]|uniref:HEPN domain-containing protein n=1 Tax=unclassified Mucilaginibacter TaxID=2617802 RepID=UPI002AC8E82F|nr:MULTISPECIES: HEPN domain-containing protein [unclassified Mucilaginibacter]MEB0248988.1 HEPN domain-containing protein [Mucilaginibacter sp. 5B2]MEB0264121.1 HEPN domain-containing protein [Mucilaginibacter sp. 10I4]MEB0302389.1 HEPN domain-containing protein [Mucilaginibacter sp. 5C4]WPX23805.1 HEPN domain-containing protein [Mucilaginibacter sp. 5C4]